MYETPASSDVDSVAESANPTVLLSIDTPLAPRESFLAARRLSSAEPPLLSFQEARQWLSSEPARPLEVSSDKVALFQPILEEAGAAIRILDPADPPRVPPREATSQPDPPNSRKGNAGKAPEAVGSWLLVLVLLLPFAFLSVQSSSVLLSPSSGAAATIEDLANQELLLNGLWLLAMAYAATWAGGLAGRARDLPVNRPGFGSFGAFCGVALPFLNLLGFPIVLRGLVKAGSGTARPSRGGGTAILGLCAWFCLLVAITAAVGMAKLAELGGNPTTAMEYASILLVSRVGTLLLLFLSLSSIDRMIRERIVEANSDPTPRTGLVPA